MRRVVLSFAVAALLLTSRGAAQPPGKNVILITLDGARSEEMFGGLDLDALRSTLPKDRRAEDTPVYKRFWADTPQARREKLMPFFWGTLMRHHGSIAGNAALGSRVRLTNRHWFSYPGYAEMLLGRAHDDVIKSNDAIRNPYRTVLEFAGDRLKVGRDGVAVFGTWGVFNEIAESREGAITINAGLEPYESSDPTVRAMSALQFRTPTPWDNTRHDIYTARFAMAHLAAFHPRVLYLALDETDDWAHDGKYDRLLDAYASTDAILRDLWTWLESDPQYRGQTSILLTTDHGRGASTGDEWRSHGAKYPRAENTWMAFVSPTATVRGEWRDHPPLESRQVASTLLQWLGLDWREFDAAAGSPVAIEPAKR